MSIMNATCDLPAESPRLVPTQTEREMCAEPRPWGFWGSLGWGLFAVATALFAVVVYTGFWMLTHQLGVPNATDAALAPVSQVALDEFAHVLSQGNQDHGGGSGEASSRLAKIAYFEEHDFKRAISLTTKKPNSSQRNKS